MKIIFVVTISEIISLLLMLKLWRSRENTIFKIFLSIVLLIPVIGPSLYLFSTDNTPVQSEYLKNDLGHGYYTQRWVTMRDLWKKFLEER